MSLESPSRLAHADPFLEYHEDMIAVRAQGMCRSDPICEDLCPVNHIVHRPFLKGLYAELKTMRNTSTPAGSFLTVRSNLGHLHA